MAAKRRGLIGGGRNQWDQLAALEGRPKKKAKPKKAARKRVARKKKPMKTLADYGPVKKGRWK